MAIHCPFAHHNQHSPVEVTYIWEKNPLVRKKMVGSSSTKYVDVPCTKKVAYVHKQIIHYLNVVKFECTMSVFLSRHIRTATVNLWGRKCMP